MSRLVYFLNAHMDLCLYHTCSMDDCVFYMTTCTDDISMVINLDLTGRLRFVWISQFESVLSFRAMRQQVQKRRIWVPLTPNTSIYPWSWKEKVLWKWYLSSNFLCCLNSKSMNSRSASFPAIDGRLLNGLCDSSTHGCTKVTNVERRRSPMEF